MMIKRKKADPKYWIFHPDIYPNIKDDRFPNDVDIPDNTIFHYYDEGMVSYFPMGNRLRMHPIVLPEHRRHSFRIVRDSLSRIEGEIEVLIPNYFIHLKRAAQLCGFKVEKTIKNQFLKNGKWYDSTVLVKQ